jgi:predicted transcriptional regulator of viral defense system
MPHRTSVNRRSGATVSDRDYGRLLTVRTGLRKFERWSAEQAAAHGLTISQVADYLLIRHHSAVELADRTEKAGLIERVRDADDHRAVRLRLSPAGERVLTALTSAHLEELAQLTALFESLIGTLTR